MSSDSPHPDLLEIRRYPNRRLYDVTRSKTVTLDELHRLIVEGHQIRVTETATGEDITSKVLTQMILDLDAGKLELFPAELLHRILQSNQGVVREFMDTHFHQALKLFLQSKEQFEEQFRKATGMADTGAAMSDWSRAFWGPLGGTTPPPAAAPASDLHQVVEDLKQQVESLRRQVSGAGPAAESS